MNDETPFRLMTSVIPTSAYNVITLWYRKPQYIVVAHCLELYDVGIVLNWSCTLLKL